MSLDHQGTLRLRKGRKILKGNLNIHENLEVGLRPINPWQDH